MIAVVRLDYSTEALSRQMIHQLGEHPFADVPARHLCLRRRPIRAIQRANRRYAQNDSLLQPIIGLRSSNHAVIGQH
jgi:hypothetical protein